VISYSDWKRRFVRNAFFVHGIFTAFFLMVEHNIFFFCNHLSGCTFQVLALLRAFHFHPGYFQSSLFPAQKKGSSMDDPFCILSISENQRNLWLYLCPAAHLSPQFFWHSSFEEQPLSHPGMQEEL